MDCFIPNPYTKCRQINLFQQVNNFIESYYDECFTEPNNKSQSFMIGSKKYNVDEFCAECLDCVIYSGITNLPVGDTPNPDSYFKLYKKVKIFYSLSKDPYRVWEDVRMDQDDTLITIYSKDESKILAYYTKSVEGAFLASGIE